MRGDPLLAWNPKPGNKTVLDVEQATQPLGWSPGDEAAEALGGLVWPLTLDRDGVVAW